MRHLDFHFQFAEEPADDCVLFVAVDPDASGPQEARRVHMTRHGGTWSGGVDVSSLVKVPFMMSWKGGPPRTPWALAVVDSWPIPHVAARYDGESSASSVGWKPGAVS